MFCARENKNVGNLKFDIKEIMLFWVSRINKETARKGEIIKLNKDYLRRNLITSGTKAKQEKTRASELSRVSRKPNRSKRGNTTNNKKTEEIRGFKIYLFGRVRRDSR